MREDIKRLLEAAQRQQEAEDIERDKIIFESQRAGYEEIAKLLAEANTTEANTTMLPGDMFSDQVIAPVAPKKRGRPFKNANSIKH